MSRLRAPRKLFVAIAATICAPFLTGAASYSTTFDARVLAAHNAERATLGIPPLRWNSDLVESAHRWGQYLASTGRFEHAPERRMDPEGENLWAGTRGYYSPEAMVGGWIREKQYFKPGAFPYNSTTGRVADVGHYTQVMWRDTDEVGCAVVRNAQEDVLVCRYRHAGNYRGERPF